MRQKSVYDRIFEIHDRTIDVLRERTIPPYPSHYKRHFDEIFLREADEGLKKNLQQDEKMLDPQAELSRYLDLAQRSLMAFAETHSDISHLAKLQGQYIDNGGENNAERCATFVEGLSALVRDMTDELEKAQQKIDALSGELQEAILNLTTDTLTQVGNRKGFADDLAQILEAGATRQLPTVLMMIDADNFKILNDEYGHLAGDKVLFFLAQSIKSLIRRGDKVYRYGGEEFAVLLTRCEQDQAYAIADKIRSKIEHSQLIYMGKTIHVTVSVGVTVHHAGDTLEEFIKRADDALYQAKKERKNCTIFFE